MIQEVRIISITLIRSRFTPSGERAMEEGGTIDRPRAEKSIMVAGKPAQAVFERRKRVNRSIEKDIVIIANIYLDLLRKLYLSQRIVLL